MASSLISIPEYFTRFIDRSIDLTKIPKICCPFHEEDTPSFSYSSEKGLWRCFGACKVGGDVIALHQKNYRTHYTSCLACVQRGSDGRWSVVWQMNTQLHSRRHTQKQ